MLLVLDLLEVLLSSPHLSVFELLHVEGLTVGQQLLPLILQLRTCRRRGKKSDWFLQVDRCVCVCVCADTQNRTLTASLSLSMMVSSSSKCRSLISSFFICVSTSRATRDLIFLSSTAARCCNKGTIGLKKRKMQLHT